MKRREFIKQLGLSMAAGWTLGRLAWPPGADAADPGLRLALLADAHLQDGREGRGEARALARAVAEIRSLDPPPDLVLWAGDLAHRGEATALDLGREILADLPAPVWAVAGEGDAGPGGRTRWGRHFGSGRFSRPCRGWHILGLDTVLTSAPGGPAFAIGASQKQWLAQEMAALDAATPLIILSHAPLARLFQPWGQWTVDTPALAPLFARFQRVLCLHGHVHGAGLAAPQLASGDDRVAGEMAAGWVNLDSGDHRGIPAGVHHLSLPATAWPLPQALLGTPARLSPGTGPTGCGWTLAALTGGARKYRPFLWQS
jgi:Icc protein